MKQLNLFLVGVLLIAGVWRVGQALKTHENIDCDEDSYLFTPPECPTEKLHYFPFPYKCHQYFLCLNYNALCIRCPPGTIWDQTYTSCMSDSETNCTIVTTPVATTPTTTAPDDPVNWICPEGYDGLIRHPYDCRFFYNCNPNRRPCLFICPDELYYNPETQQCDLQLNVPDCKGGSPPPASTTPSVLGLPKGRSLNYRNVNRQNFAETVRYLYKTVKVNSAEDPDPCEMVKTYLEV